MSRRGFLAAGSSVAAAALLSACNSGGTTGGGKGGHDTGDVGDMMLLSNPWNTIMQSSAASAAKLLGLGETGVSFDADPGKAVTLAQQFATGGKKMVYLNPSDGSELPGVMRVAESNKVYAGWISQGGPWYAPLDSSYFAGFRGEDFYTGFKQVCTLMFDALVKAKGSNAKIIVISGFPGGAADYQRGAGLKDALKNYPGIQVLGSKPGSWSAEGGQAATQALVSAHGKPDAVVVYNDGMCTGVLPALKGLGIEPGQDALVCAQDGTPDIIQAVNKGEVFATGGPTPQFFGVAIIALLFDCLNGYKYSALEKQMLGQSLQITKDNVADFLKRYGDSKHLPFDPRKMSRVWSSDWDPMEALTPLNMDTYWSVVKDPPDGYQDDPDYTKQKNADGFAKIAKMYKDHNKIAMDDYSYVGPST